MANLYELKKFDLNLLVIFECIYQHLSISKAAETLYITPSAVSQSLQRLRNQLNSQQRWGSLFERPVQLYESQRLLYTLQGGAITPLLLTEPRDAELRQLSWSQQLITLSLEARDALAPQLQSFVRRLGDLVVVLLTQVVGRAIGLVGRGILQGMGRTVGRS